MKKTLLYAVAAIVLGILLTLIPLITLTGIEAEKYETSREAFANSMDKLENIDGFRAESYLPDLKLFVFSFAVAIFAYAIFKFRVIR
ncbi:MAG: hypothetical protein ACUVUF_00840 [Candidatus Bathycorpusculaceae bacterium]